MMNTISLKGISVVVAITFLFSLFPSLPVKAANVLTYGAEAVFESGDSTYIDVAALSETKVVISYRDEGNSNRGTAVVGTVSGNSITFGTPVVFYNDNAAYIRITKLDSDSVAIAYTDVDNDGSAIVGDVSGTSISFNTPAEFTADSNNFKDIDRLDDTHFLVAWNNTIGTQLDATVGTVAGGNITYSSTGTLDGDSTTSLSIAGLTSTTAIIIANDTGNSTRGLAHGITVSAGAVTAVDSWVFDAAESTFISTVPVTSTRAFTAYFNDGFGKYGFSTYSAGVVTSTGYQYFDESSVSRMANTLLTGTTTAVIAYRSADSKGKAIFGSIDGTTFTPGTSSTFTNSSFNNLGAAAVSATQVVIAYQDNSNGGRGTALVATYGAQAVASSESGGGGTAAWLIDMRKKNGLDAWGRPLSSSSTSSSVSSSIETSVSSSANSISSSAAASTISSSVRSVSSASSRSTKSVAAMLFSDTPLSSWYYSDLQKLYAIGVISGYKNKSGNDTGMFGPADVVSFGQFAKMMSLLTNHPPSGTKATMHWAEPYVRSARAIGLTAYADATLNLDMPVSRAVAVRTILEAYGISLSSLPQSTFTDLAAKHPYARDMLTAVALSIIQGDANKKTVRPDATINRAEIVNILADVASRFTAVDRVPASIVAQASSSASVSSAPKLMLGKTIGVVATPTLNLRSDARINSTILYELRQGAQMEIIRIVYDDWAQIRLADGREGYVWVHYLSR